MPNHVRGLDEEVKARCCALIKVISLKFLRSSVNYYVKNITLLIKSLYWAIPCPGPGYDLRNLSAQLRGIMLVMV